MDASRPNAREGLPSLTGLRFWAALLVVLYHLSREYHRLPLLSPLVWYGRDGVTFFFVLSGFVLAWSYAAAGIPARVFYWRRFARVWPMHMAATGLALSVSLLAGVALPLTAVLWSVPLLQAWSPPLVYGGNPAAWSLSAEAWFYLLLPLLLPFLVRRGNRALAAIAVGACAAGLVLWLGGALIGPPALRDWALDYLPLSRTPQFLLGAAAGVAVRRGWRPRLPVPAAVAALVLWHLALIPWSDAVPQGVWYSPYSGSQLLVAPLYAVLVTAAAGHDADGLPSRLGGRLMRRLGHYSFAWYLVHQTCLRLVLCLCGAPHSVAAALAGWLLVGCLSLALAGLLFHRVERPVESLLRARGPGFPTSVPGAARARHRPGKDGQLLPAIPANGDGEPVGGAASMTPGRR